MDLLASELKIRETKKWKDRFCLLQKPSQDQLILLVYKSEKNYRKSQHPKEIIPFEDYFGVESGFLYERESYTLAIICAPNILLLAFETQDTLVEWEHNIRKYLGQTCQFRIQVVQTPGDSDVEENTRARLHVHDGQFGFVADCPPRLTAGWSFDHLRRYGPLHNKFCFELGSSVGRGAGMYVLLSGQNDQIAAAFSLASKNVLNLQLVKSSRLPFVGNLHQIDENSIAKTRQEESSKESLDQQHYRQRKTLTRVPFRSENDINPESYSNRSRHFSNSPVEIPYAKAAKITSERYSDPTIMKQKLKHSRSGSALESTKDERHSRQHSYDSANSLPVKKSFSEESLTHQSSGISNSLQLDQKSLKCGCDRHNDYINQAFIDSLKHYYNIDKVVLSVSQKLRCCDHDCTSPPSPPIDDLIRCRPAAVQLQVRSERNEPPPELPPRRGGNDRNHADRLLQQADENEVPPDPVISSTKRQIRTESDGINVDMEVLSVVTKVKSPPDRSDSRQVQRKLRSSETDLSHFPLHNSLSWSYFHPPDWRNSIAHSDITANRDSNCRSSTYAISDSMRSCGENYPHVNDQHSQPIINHRKTSDYTNLRPPRGYEKPKSPMRKFSMPTLEPVCGQFGSSEELYRRRFLSNNSALRGSTNSLIRSGSAKVRSFVNGFVRGAFGSAVNLSNIDKPKRPDFPHQNFPIHMRSSSYSTPFGFRDSMEDDISRVSSGHDPIEDLDEIRDDVFMSLPRQFAQRAKLRQHTDPLGAALRHSEMNHSASLSTISGSVRVRSDNRHHSRLHSADVQYDLSPVRNFHSPTRKFSNSFSVSSALDSIHELDQPQFGQFPSRNNNFGGSMATVPTGLDNVCQKKPKYRPKNLDSITKPICGESFDRYDTPKIRGDPDPNFVDFYIPGNPHKGGQMRSRKSASVNFNFSNLDKSLIGPTVTPSVAATVRTAAKTLLERRLSERANMQLPQSAGWHRSTSNFFKFPDRLDDLNYLELDRSDGSSNVSTPRSPMPKTPGFRPVTPGLPGVSVNYTDVDIVATIAAQKVSQDRSEEREKFSEMSRSSSAASLNHSDSSAPSGNDSKGKKFRKKFTSSLLERGRIKNSSLRRTSLSSLTESN